MTNIYNILYKNEVLYEIKKKTFFLLSNPTINIV